MQAQFSEKISRFDRHTLIRLLDIITICQYWILTGTCCIGRIPVKIWEWQCRNTSPTQCVALYVCVCVGRKICVCGLWICAIIGFFVGLFAVPCVRASKLKFENMYVCRTREQFKTNTQVLKMTPVNYRRVVSCPVPPQSCHWDCFFFDTISVAWN